MNVIVAIRMVPMRIKFTILLERFLYAAENAKVVMICFAVMEIGIRFIIQIVMVKENFLIFYVL